MDIITALYCEPLQIIINSMTEPLKISALGKLHIKQGEDTVSGLARKAQALFVYLVCTGRPHDREMLASLLWSEHTQDRAMNSLRVLLTPLRRALGPYLTITRRTVAFNQSSNYWLDVAELDQGLATVHKQQLQSNQLSKGDLAQLAQTMVFYQGEFLAGFNLRDSQGFEEWLLLERERLQLQVIEGLDWLIAGYLRLEDYQAGIEPARRLLRLDPLREATHRRLMQLYALTGQQTAALRQYETCQQILDEELGVPPAEETTALYEAIKTKQLRAPPRTKTSLDSVSAERDDEKVQSTQKSMAAEEQAAISPLLSRSPAPLHNLPPQPTLFIGREEELAEITRLLLRESACHMLTLVGPGGMGKTRLSIQAALQAVSDGLDLFSAWFIFA